MFRGKRSLSSCAVLGVLVVLVLPASAQAGDNSSACVVSGEAKVVDKDDSAMGMRLVGGAGTFDLEWDAVCVGVAKGTPQTVFTAIEAEGYYHSTVCATDKWIGWFRRFSHSKYDAMYGGRKFALVQFGGIGFLYKHRPGGIINQKPFVDPKDLGFLKTWQFFGTVFKRAPSRKQPISPPNALTNHCTKAIGLDGVILLEDTL